MALNTDIATDFGECLRGLVAMLDDGSRGLKGLVGGSRVNDCGCHCCDDDDDDLEELRTQLANILESEAAIRARRVLALWEWSR